MDSYIDNFRVFLHELFGQIRQISPSVCYLEMGKQHIDDVMGFMHMLYPTYQVWGITYYKKNPCYLIRGGQVLLDPHFDFTGRDDEHTPALAIEAEHPAIVVDLCTGRGLTLLAAHKYGAAFCGIELNKRRLAVAIDRAAKQGIRYENCGLMGGSIYDDFVSGE
jgi:hypothetical protein